MTLRMAVMALAAASGLAGMSGSAEAQYYYGDGGYYRPQVFQPYRAPVYRPPYSGNSAGNYMVRPYSGAYGAGSYMGQEYQPPRTNYRTDQSESNCRWTKKTLWVDTPYGYEQQSRRIWSCN